MTDQTLTLGWTTAQTARALRTYRLVLGFNMAVHVLIGLACIFCSGWVSRMAGLPETVPVGWEKGWGATLILVTALYVPGWYKPLVSHLPNVIGIGGRVWMALIWLFCGGGFLWFALFDGIFAVVLGLLYRKLLTAQLMTHP
ncbi:hypothetical protein [Labrys neptuniae]